MVKHDFEVRLSHACTSISDVHLIVPRPRSQPTPGRRARLAVGGVLQAWAIGLAAENVTEMDRKISGLRAMQDSLRRLVDTCEKPRHQRECPLLGALADGDQPANLGSTP